MARTLETSVRASVQALHTQASLRELGAVLGVSRQAVWSLVQGRHLRPSTLRRIAQGLAVSREAVATDQLLDALTTLLRPLRASERRDVEHGLGAVIEEAFRRAGHAVPVWVPWLREGRRSIPSAQASVEALLKQAQAGSKGGARALKQRRG